MGVRSQLGVSTYSIRDLEFHATPLIASDAYKKNFRLLVSNSGFQAHSTSPLPVSFPSVNILLSSPLPAMPLLIHNSFIVNLGPSSCSPTFSTTISPLPGVGKRKSRKENVGLRQFGERESVPSLKT